GRRVAAAAPKDGGDADSEEAARDGAADHEDRQVEPPAPAVDREQSTRRRGAHDRAGRAGDGPCSRATNDDAPHVFHPTARTDVLRARAVRDTDVASAAEYGPAPRVERACYGVRAAAHRSSASHASAIPSEPASRSRQRAVAAAT